jgi:hypothetical protein
MAPLPAFGKHARAAPDDARGRAPLAGDAAPGVLSASTTTSTLVFFHARLNFFVFAAAASHPYPRGIPRAPNGAKGIKEAAWLGEQAQLF